MIQKCNLCSNSRIKEGRPTACAEACPTGAILFGKRDELIKIARRRINDKPDLYLDHIYGEKEVGGTNVLYLTKRMYSLLLWDSAISNTRRSPT